MGVVVGIRPVNVNLPSFGGGAPTGTLPSTGVCGRICGATRDDGGEFCCCCGANGSIGALTESVEGLRVGNLSMGNAAGLRMACDA